MVPTERAVLAALLAGSFHIIRSLRSPAFSARLSFVVKLPCSGFRVVYSYHHKKTSAREAFLWCRQRELSLWPYWPARSTSFARFAHRRSPPASHS